MTYDDGLTHRIRETLGDRPGLTEKEMFGGIAFMLQGNMVCGVVDDSLMARVGPDAYDEALEATHARPMDFTGRPMRGLVFVDPPGLTSDEGSKRGSTGVSPSLSHSRRSSRQGKCGRT